MFKTIKGGYNKKTILIENDIFFKRLKDCRLKAGLSQTELSTMLNVGVNTIYRYERKDIKRINIDLLNNLSKILNVSTEYLLGKSDDCNYGFFGRNEDKEPSNRFFSDLGTVNRVENLNGLQSVRTHYFQYLVSQLDNEDFFKVINFTENLIAEKQHKANYQQKTTQSENNQDWYISNFKTAEELSKENPYAAFGGIHLSKQNLQAILEIINQSNQGTQNQNNPNSSNPNGNNLNNGFDCKE